MPGRSGDASEEGAGERRSEREEKRGHCGCNSITHTGSDHELSRQSIYESISYHDTISCRRGGLLLLSSRTVR